MSKQKVEKMRSRRRKASIFMLFGLMLGFLMPMLHTTSVFAITGGEVEEGMKKTNTNSSPADKNDSKDNKSDSGSGSDSNSSSGSSSSDSGSDSSSSDNNDMFAKGASVQAGDLNSVSTKYAGNAFSYLGGTKNALSSLLSAWQSNYSYDSLYSLDNGKGGAFTDAAAFAYQMNATGLDKNTTPVGDGGATGIGGHPFLGLGVLVALKSNYIVSAVFRFIGNLLNSLNIFAWLAGISDGSSLCNTGFGQFCHEIYAKVRDMGLLVASIVCVVGVGLAVFGADAAQRKGGAAMGNSIFNKIWKFFLKYLVAFGAFAMLASAYGVLATNVKEMCDEMGAANPADYLVTSNIVDFRDWAYRTRLSLSTGGQDSLNSCKADVALPNTTKINASKYKTPIIRHDTISAINANLAGLNTGMAAESNSGFTSGFSKEDGSYMQPLMGKAMTQNSAKETNADTEWLLSQWKNGAGCTAPGYASYALSKLADGKGGYFTGKALTGGKSSDKSDSSSSSGDSDSSDSDNALSAFREALSSNKSSDTSKPQSSYKACGITSASQMPFMNGTLHSSGNYLVTQSSNSWPVATNRDGGGLSTLGMYVYLSSTFNSTSMTYYDLSKGTNANVSAIHATAVVPNNGIIYWASIIQMTIVPLIMFLFGLVCAYTMFVDILMKLPKVFTESFATGFGSESGFLKALGSFAELAIAMIGTCAFYGIGMDVMKFVIDFADDFKLSAIVPSTVANANVVQGALSDVAYGGFEIVITGVLAFIAFKFIKARRKLLDALVGMISNGTKKFVHALYGFGLANGGSTSVANNYGGDSSSDEHNNNESNGSSAGGHGAGGHAGGSRLGGGHGGGLLPGKPGSNGSHGSSGGREAAMGNGKNAEKAVNGDNGKNAGAQGHNGANGGNTATNGADKNGANDGAGTSVEGDDQTGLAGAIPGGDDMAAQMLAGDGDGSPVEDDSSNVDNNESNNPDEQNDDIRNLEGDNNTDMQGVGDGEGDENQNIEGDQASQDENDNRQLEGNQVDGDQAGDQNIEGNQSIDQQDASNENESQQIEGNTDAQDTTNANEDSTQVEGSDESTQVEGANEDQSTLDNGTNVDGSNSTNNSTNNAASGLEGNGTSSTTNSNNNINNNGQTSATTNYKDSLAANGFTSMNDAQSQIADKVASVNAAKSVARDGYNNDNRIRNQATKRANAETKQLNQLRQAATSAWRGQSMEANNLGHLMDRNSSSTTTGAAYKALTSLNTAQQQVAHDAALREQVGDANLSRDQLTSMAQHGMDYQNARSRAESMGLNAAVIDDQSVRERAIGDMQKNLGNILHSNE